MAAHIHHHETPGEPLSATNQAMTAAASALQDLTPVKHICAHFNGFHSYASDLTRAVNSEHYCSMVNDEVRQCLVYDDTGPNARLIGVEYLISPRLFATLDDDEKKLWHTHIFEVKSGMIIMPGPKTVPDIIWEKVERKELEQIVHIYGKTYHFWQVDRGDPIPLGQPQLMVAYTDESQVDLEKVLRPRDEKYGTDYKHKQEIRKDIEEPELDPLANYVVKNHNWKKEIPS